MLILVWVLVVMWFFNVVWKLVVLSDIGKIGDVYVGMWLLLLL